MGDRPLAKARQMIGGDKVVFDIIAVDFDGTIVTDRFPEIGKPDMELICWLKEVRAKGTRLILWSCRVGETLADAVEYCKKFGLEFDAVNENLPENIEKYGNDCRKVFADLYIDDKAFRYNINEHHKVEYSTAMEAVELGARRILNGELPYQWL